MRRILGMMIVAMSVSGVGFAKDATFPLNGENTKIEWTGTKPDGKHEGGFKKLTGTASQTKDGLSFEVEINCDSLYADDEKLTQHLKSADFFSVKDHPKAKFKSTKVESTADGQMVTGELTLLGKKKKVSFPAKIVSGETLGLKASFKINRQDFGMTYGAGKIDDEVEIRLNLKAAAK